MSKTATQKYESKEKPDFEKEVHGILTKLFKDVDDLKERVKFLETSGGN